jgi:hypothetical protein
VEIYIASKVIAKTDMGFIPFRTVLNMKEIGKKKSSMDRGKSSIQMAQGMRVNSKMA